MKRDAEAQAGAGVSVAEREQALAALLQAVEEVPRAHDFFALLRRVEGLRPEMPRWGCAARPAQEPLRLGQEPELDFAVAALESFTPRLQGPPRLGVRFFGLLGPQGPMPLHITEYVRERLRLRGDPTIARFLDVFHHRLLALFYRAWAQAQPAVQHDRPAEDRYAAWLGASIGLGSELPGQSSLPAPARLSQAGLLGSRSRHAEGLAKMLAGYFRVPVRIEQHVPQWLVLDDDDRSRLGYATNRAERLRATSAQLGVSAAAGNKVRDRQYRFRIVLGPLTLAQHEAFLPAGPAWRELSDWVLQYCGPGLRWDVQLTLAAAEVPEPRLGRRVRLGVTGWLGRTPIPRDRGDLRLRPHTSFLIRSGVHHA